MEDSRSVPDPRAVKRIEVERFRDARLSTDVDLVTVEEPLEIRVVVEEEGQRKRHSVAVTMRTPGRDHELATGFLVSEGVVRQAGDIWRIEHCREDDSATASNVIDVVLAPQVSFSIDRLSRQVVTSSACGICGRTSIDSVRQICRRLPRRDLKVSTSTLEGFTASLEDSQSVFWSTGGLHAAALFDGDGRKLVSREDVGRHNAFDKMVGSLLDAQLLPAADRVAMVSGRASFELVQKAILAGIPMLIAVGAASSLAIELAIEYGMTLIGFFRGGRFNVYCGSERLTCG